MPRLRRSAVAVLAGAALAAWWGTSGSTGLYRQAAGPRASPPAARWARVRPPAPATAVAAPRPPRPGRAISYFGAKSRGADLAKVARDLIEEHREELGLAAM